MNRFSFLSTNLLEVEVDTSNAREFLKHEYNRDGDSYRSPWSNAYFPTSDEASVFPSPDLLKMEQKANEIFATYVRLYYDYAISSVYFVDSQEGQGFSGCFLVKKEMKNESSLTYGNWDAIHIVSCNLTELPKVTYRIVSTVMISLEAAESEKVGTLQIAGSCAKTAQETVSVPADFGTRTDPN